MKVLPIVTAHYCDYFDVFLMVRFVETQKYKNTSNNYSKIFTVMGALKSLLCYTLDIDVNDILNYHTNYLLRKCCKKVAGLKQLN